MEGKMIKLDTILIVEDDTSQQMFERFTLLPMANNIDIAEDGASALKMLEEKTYDLIIMDIGLPDMSGFDVSKKYREMEKTPKTPIIVISAQLQETPVEKYYEKKIIDESFEKPIDIKKIQKFLAERVITTPDKKPR